MLRHDQWLAQLLKGTKPALIHQLRSASVDSQHILDAGILLELVIDLEEQSRQSTQLKLEQNTTQNLKWSAPASGQDSSLTGPKPQNQCKRSQAAHKMVATTEKATTVSSPNNSQLHSLVTAVQGLVGWLSGRGGRWGGSN